jgi:hypothetical protein
MKKVYYTDNNGYLHCSLLRDNDDETKAKFGIPLEPPPIDSILEDAKRELHNDLVRNNLFTWEDVQASQNGVTNAVTRCVTHPLKDAFRQKEQGKNAES